MEENIYSILNIDGEQKVSVKGKRDKIYVNETIGLIYRTKDGFTTEYFTKTDKFRDTISLFKEEIPILAYYERQYCYSDYLPYIRSGEFGTTIYFMDKEVIDILKLKRGSSSYVKHTSLKKETDFKTKACLNGKGAQFSPSSVKKYQRNGVFGKQAADNFKKSLGIESSTFIASEGLKYSFGVELESSGGRVEVSDYFLNRLNLSSIRDGSVSGSEYVTGVLKGDNGFNQLYNISRLLNKHNKVDKTCGMHVHIGGANFNQAFSVYAHILSEKIQDSMFSIVAKTRRGNNYCGDVIRMGLSADISKYGPKYGVEIAYDRLFEGMTYGKKLSGSYNKKHNHHFGRYCGKYNGISDNDNFRYKWINLIPCNFNVRKVVHPRNGYDSSSDTIEFRFHSGTFNYTKIKNFTLICMAFVHYVENNQKDIISKDVITLEDIITATYKRNTKSLLAYVDERRKLFNNEPDLLESSDNQAVLKTKKERICV